MSKQKQNYLYLTGNDGLYDTTFPTSPKGQKGEQGYHGTDGQKGARGDKGSDGQPGAMTQVVGSWSFNSSDNLPLNGTFPVGWDDGVNPPVPFDVEIGETMYNTTTHELWTYTPGSTVSGWTYLGNAQSIKGQIGDKGSTGDKGQKGELGTDGINGEKGQKGYGGDKGQTGDKGHTGDKGQRGDQGFKGASGSNGTKGNPGVDGIDGEDGTNGTKGQKGTEGVKGTRGTVGPRGLKGEEGDPGNPSWFPRVAVSFNGEVMDIFDGYGVLNINKNDVGEYKVNFSKVLSNNRYTTVATTSNGYTVRLGHRKNDSVILKVRDEAGDPVDSDYVSAIIYKFAA